MYNESQLKVANLILKNKVFKYKKTIGIFEGFTFYFTAKITGQRIMYHAGNPYDTIQVDVKIVRIEGLGAGVFKIANHLKKTFNRVEMLNSYNFNNGMDYIMRDIGDELSKTLKVLDSNISVQVENMTIPDNVEIIDGFDLYKQNITESKVSKNMIRTIVKDIVSILKLKKESEFYLPGALTNQDRYSFIGFSDFDVVVDVNFKYENELGTDYKIEAGFQTTENTLEFIFELNPERLEKNLHSIIGELNDYVAHELQHLRQQDEGRISGEDFIGSNFNYFMQPDEIEAQYYGLKRRAKLTGLSLDEVVDDYFTFKQDVFNLTDDEVNQIKNAVITYQPHQG